MYRIALDIDPVALVRNVFAGKEPDPVTSIVLGELGGAESIVCYLRDDLKTVNERDVNLFKHVTKTHLNVRCNITEENIRKLIRLKVDMITFVAPGNVTSISPTPLSPSSYGAQLQNFIAELRSNNILSSILVQPEINEIKDAGRLEFDYIEIDASELDKATDMQAEFEFMENINGLTLAASKLGMGVNISGGISYDNIREIAAIQFIEDIIVGKPLLDKALSIGFEQAMRDLHALI